MLFKKYVKMAVTTISFADSLFDSLYYVENELQYDFN